MCEVGQEEGGGDVGWAEVVVWRGRSERRRVKKEEIHIRLGHVTKEYHIQSNEGSNDWAGKDLFLRISLEKSKE